MKDKVLLAYLAGIIDGEGSIGFHKNGKRTNKRFVIEVRMTTKDIIVLLHETLGGVLSECKVVKGCKPQWRWRVLCNEAKAVYALLEPYLRLKRR